MANLGGGSAESQIYDASELIMSILGSGEQEGTVDVEQAAILKEAIQGNKMIVFSVPGGQTPVALLCGLLDNLMRVELSGAFGLEIKLDNNTYKKETYSYKKYFGVETKSNFIHNGHYYDYGLVKGTLFLNSTASSWDNFEARIEFQSGDVPPKIKDNSGIRLKWASDITLLEDGTPKISSNKKYLINIIRSFAWLYEFDI